MISQHLRHCGGCGSDELCFDGQKLHQCTQCGWRYYANPAAAAAALLWHSGELLMVRRNRNPGCGLLDLPGGFVDPDESAEQALQRELDEELRLPPLAGVHYVGSYPNRYPYRGLEYTVVDLVFEATLPQRPTWFDPDELGELVWVEPNSLDLSDVAFPSVRQCLRERFTHLGLS